MSGEAAAAAELTHRRAVRPAQFRAPRGRSRTTVLAVRYRDDLFSRFLCVLGRIPVCVGTRPGVRCLGTGLPWCLDAYVCLRRHQP